MCGIAGVVSNRKVEEFRIREMLAPLQKRGPDFSKILIQNNVGLGHARLSIIDLSSRANQPMQAGEGRYSIVFNGEIYNYRTLKTGLERQGFSFDSSSDTEVILNGFINEGESFFSRMEGMWALAIWDDKKSELTLSRDRFGEKPLYYKWTNQELVFGSNLASVTKHDTLKINHTAIAELISMQFIHTENCIYSEYKKLPPGCNLKLRVNEQPIITTYWEPNYCTKISVRESEAIDKIEELLINAVKNQITSSDVPVGIFLSGGVDSGLIGAIAAKHHPEITAITMTVPNSSRDEYEFAKVIADKHKLKLKAVALDENCVGELPYLLEEIEPLADSSLLPLAFVSGKAVEHFKVALTGDGGDEIFGGYGMPLRYLSRGKQHNFISKNVAKFLIENRNYNQITRLLKSYSLSQKSFNTFGLDLFFELQDSATQNMLKLIMQQPSAPGYIKKTYQNLFNNNQTLFNDDIGAILLSGIKGRLAGDFLHKVDSGTMFHSLESRSPFLSHTIFDYVSTLPNDILFNSSTDKYLIKKLAEKYNPKDIIYAQKRGFSIPTEDYFHKGWGKLLTEFLEEGISQDAGLINRRGVKQLLSQHRKFKPLRLSNQLYAILVIEIWLRVFHFKTHKPEVLKERILKAIRS